MINHLSASKYTCTFTSLPEKIVSSWNKSSHIQLKICLWGECWLHFGLPFSNTVCVVRWLTFVNLHLTFSLTIIGESTWAHIKLCVTNERLRCNKVVVWFWQLPTAWGMWSWCRQRYRQVNERPSVRRPPDHSSPANCTKPVLECLNQPGEDNRRGNCPYNCRCCGVCILVGRSQVTERVSCFGILACVHVASRGFRVKSAADQLVVSLLWLELHIFAIIAALQFRIRGHYKVNSSVFPALTNPQGQCSFRWSGANLQYSCFTWR